MPKTLKRQTKENAPYQKKGVDPPASFKLMRMKKYRQYEPKKHKTSILVQPLTKKYRADSSEE